MVEIGAVGGWIWDVRSIKSCNLLILKVRQGLSPLARTLLCGGWDAEFHFFRDGSNTS